MLHRFLVKRVEKNTTWGIGRHGTSFRPTRHVVSPDAARGIFRTPSEGLPIPHENTGGKAADSLLLLLLLRILLNEVVGGIKSVFSCLREVAKPLLNLPAKDVGNASSIISTWEVRVEFEGTTEGPLGC